MIPVHTLYRMPRKPKPPLRPLLRVRGGNIPAFRCAVRRVHEIEDREREVRPWEETGGAETAMRDMSGVHEDEGGGEVEELAEREGEGGCGWEDGGVVQRD